MIEIHVIGCPIAQPRPRVTMRGKFAHAYTPKSHAIHGWKNAVIKGVAEAFTTPDPTPRLPLTGPLCVTITCFMPRPQAHFKRGELRADAPHYHTSRCDVDNLFKGTIDALTDCGLWADDSIIAKAVITKQYARKVPGATILIQALPDESTGLPFEETVALLAKQKQLQPNEYRCDMCQRVYRKGRPDSEAAKEARERLGDLMDTEPIAVVCDDCHKKLCKQYGWK